MKTTIFLSVVVIVGLLGTAGAVSSDTIKSDITISTETKDLSSVMIGISVEWQSNISVTSQGKSNVRAMTEMAVIEEIQKYDANDLEYEKFLIEDNIRLNLLNKTRNSDISVIDVKVTKIIPKEKLITKNQPEVIKEFYIPGWIWFLIIAAFIIGYFLGFENGKNKTTN